MGADFACTATTRGATAKWSAQADSALKSGLDSMFQEVLTVVESGHGVGTKVWGICIGRGALFLHLEMSEQGGGTQVFGEYCRSVS